MNSLNTNEEKNQMSRHKIARTQMKHFKSATQAET